MNFEKEYKNVFEHAKSAYGTGAYDDYTLEQLFPQLKETEDERIRKTLIDALKTSKSVGELKFILPEPTRKDCIAYLEKQKEEKLDSIRIKCKEHDERREEIRVTEIIESIVRVYGKTQGEFIAGYDIDTLIHWVREAFDCLNKQNIQKEQKPIKMEVYEVGKGTTICGQDYKCKKDYKEGNCWYIKDVVYHCSKDGYLTDQNGISWSCTPEWFNEYIYTNNELVDEEKNNFVSGQFLQCKLSFDGFKEGEHYWLEYIGNDMYVGRSDNILNQKFHITPRQLYTLFSQQLEEKQKEQKVDIDKLRRDLYQSGYNDGYQHGKEDAQKEQKPVEWDDYTETNLDRALLIIKNAKGNLQGYQSDDGIYECDKAIECIEHILYRGINIDVEWAENNYPKDIEKDATQFCFDKGINITPSQAKQIAIHYLMIGHNDGYVEGRKNAHITEVMGFKVGDVVRLKDGDGRHHVIKSFEKVAGIHGSDFYRVEFEDDSARDHIFPDDYPNHTQMVKI